MKKVLSLLILMLFLINSHGQGLTNFFNSSNTFFKAYVDNGRVDYDKIYSNQKSLNDLLLLAENIRVSKNEASNYQAFWINAYNISVIKGIIGNYPTNSPLNHKGFFDGIKYNIGGERITLNDIENNFLRKQFKDPRFHFVLVCGALGCPPIIKGAYFPETLNEQLDTQTKKAINSDYFIRVNLKKKRIEGSEILKWYKGDFRMNGAKEIDFFNKYRDEKIGQGFKLTYFPYDWTLNKK